MRGSEGARLERRAEHRRGTRVWRSAGATRRTRRYPHSCSPRCRAATPPAWLLVSVRSRALAAGTLSRRGSVMWDDATARQASSSPNVRRRIFVVSGSHCALDRVAGIGEKLLPERSWYSGLVGVERRRYRCLCRVDEALRAARQVAPARRPDRRTGLQSLRALPRVSAATLGGARAGRVRARRRRRLAKARVVARARLVERPAAEARVRAKRDGKRRRHATAEPRLRRLRKTGPPPITPGGLQSCESACPP